MINVNMLFTCDQLQILLSSGDAEGAERVAMAAMQRFSQSVSVWNLSLQTLMELGSDNVGSLLQEALKHINPKVCTHAWSTTVVCCRHFLGLHFLFSNVLYVSMHQSGPVEYVDKDLPVDHKGTAGRS